MFLRLLNQRVEVIKRRILDGLKENVLIVCHDKKLRTLPKIEFPADIEIAEKTKADAMKLFEQEMEKDNLETIWILSGKCCNFTENSG